MINALLSRYAQVTYTKNIKIRETELKDELKKSVESKSEKKQFLLKIAHENQQ